MLIGEVMDINTVCEESTNIEISILFWTLIVAMASLIVTIIISIISNRQSVKLNSINLLKDTIGESFQKCFLETFCEEITDCKYKVVFVDESGEQVQVSFDKVPLIKIQNKISSFLGEVAFLKYAIPWRYSRLNCLGQHVISYIDDVIIPCAIFENAPHKIDFDEKNIITLKKAKKIHRKFLRHVRKFCKKAFKMYKYGI